MIKVQDNRKTNECQLAKVEVGKCFMYYDVLFRRCWWAESAFTQIDWNYNNIVCMNMLNGEVQTIHGDAWVQPLADRQIELYVED